MNLRIAHLYPKAMNLYGDKGNIMVLIKRCQWRGIEVKLERVGEGETIDFSSCDILFMGGGPDSAQRSIADDLLAKGDRIREAVERGICALTICGAYQLFGRYFKTKDGAMLPGIGIFDHHTEAGDRRMIGNALVDCSELLAEEVFPTHGKDKAPLELVGFENHSGRTFLGEGCKPLGKVIRGYGNDGSSGLEGCRYKNAFGTYLHGPLLPKNPWFADYLIRLGLERRYGHPIELEELDDTIEMAAFKVARRKSLTSVTPHL